jgi:putative hydrolase of the HAD superfamily
MSFLHPGIRAVFFDAVGTLLFPVPSAPQVYASVARRHGLVVSPADVHRRFVAAFRAEEEADQLAGWVTTEVREVARWRRIVSDALPGVTDPVACFRELFEHFARPNAWRVNPDAPDVFRTLQDRDLVLGLASNYDARLWSVIDGHPGLDPLRSRVLVSAAVGHRKPSARFFAEVVRAAGTNPSAVLLVGDDLGNDYEGARAAGLAAVLLDEQDRYPGVPQRIRSIRELIA